MRCHEASENPRWEGRAGDGAALLSAAGKQPSLIAGLIPPRPETRSDGDGFLPASSAF